MVTILTKHFVIIVRDDGSEEILTRKEYKEMYE